MNIQEIQKEIDILIDEFNEIYFREIINKGKYYIPMPEQCVILFKKINILREIGNSMV